ncbi:type VI secretion system-associated protein TagF [Roseomonas sp. BN140053]|uniref:type VI secretion system-associated protein TagF n=1 Tax=Roseomonas sp. BN140053 TaxID=3391898 RepID=UPI0039EC1CC3
MAGDAVTGFFGKMPAHGDFVRRNLPASFVGPWDEWLQSGIAAAREELGENWAAAWEGAPAWRFALPAGACGPEPVAGLLLPSRDTVGRLFPLTLAAVPAAVQPGETWFAALEALAREARAGGMDADRLAEALPAPEGEGAEAPGWWTPELEWPLAALLPAEEFALLLEVPHP